MSDTVSLARRPEVRLGVVVAVAVAAGLVAWLLVRGGGTTHAHVTPAHAVSAVELAALPSTVHHPVYWAGPQPGTTYEVRVTSAGLVFLRYLPAPEMYPRLEFSREILRLPLPRVSLHGIREDHERSCAHRSETGRTA